MNRQFKSYALLGSGRIARHFQFYLKSLGLPVTFWSRNGDREFNSFGGVTDADLRLAKTLAQASHVLLAVSDRALPELGQKVLNEDRMVVHFSGATTIPGIHGAHPLMTFGPKPQIQEWYAKIPFILDSGDEMGIILPGLPNPSLCVTREQRPLYHALVSLAGNSSFLLWRGIGDAFAQQLALPRELLAPFLHQVVENATRGESGAFTGPVARGDWPTVEAHLHALGETPLARNYQDYLKSASRHGHPVPKEML